MKQLLKLDLILILYTESSIKVSSDFVSVFAIVRYIPCKSKKT